jgi:hypothetical protein
MPLVANVMLAKIGLFALDSGLNVAGQITLESWVKPGATQGSVARVISHGPPTLSVDTGGEVTNSVVSGSEVYLRIQDSGATYAFGTSDGTNTHAVTFAEGPCASTAIFACSGSG